MKLTVKTESVYGAYMVLSAAKYGKLTDDEKIKVWKIARALKPVATKFEEDSKDAYEKLKPYEGFDDDLQKANEYQTKIKKADLDASTLPMGPAEYDAFMKQFNQYQKTVSEAMKEFARTEVELTFEQISEETFQKLMESNDWTFGQVTAIGDVIVM